MRTVVVKDYREYGRVKYLSQQNDFVHRKHDGTAVVEVINVGDYGVVHKVFTTERTLEESGASYKYI